ncbi:MAG: PLDc N-terminal domain-containing protein [Microbacteriaceae bacterium]|nr:PLDc N-terminal domain-containing protein [Microbacteriaceae bacterium]MCL2795243.1 PLDc N-terminal domain-containing protein [Microbacteriaceae bacterium]
MSRTEKKKFSDLSTPAQVGTVLLGIAQVSFAALAFVDLAGRPAEEIKGPKPLWIPVILVNWVGPATYFLAGRKR